MDADLSAFWTASVLVPVAGNIARIDVAQPGLVADLGGAVQGGDRRGGHVEEFVVWAESRDVPRDVRIDRDQEFSDGTQRPFVVVAAGVVFYLIFEFISLYQKYYVYLFYSSYVQFYIFLRVSLLDFVLSSHHVAFLCLWLC